MFGGTIRWNRKRCLRQGTSQTKRALGGLTAALGAGNMGLRIVPSQKTSWWAWQCFYFWWFYFYFPSQTFSLLLPLLSLGLELHSLSGREFYSSLLERHNLEQTCKRPPAVSCYFSYSLGPSRSEQHCYTVLEESPQKRMAKAGHYPEEVFPGWGTNDDERKTCCFTPKVEVAGASWNGMLFLLLNSCSLTSYR